jgi:DNA-binding beta-propeller fold protein YncE
MQRGGVRGRITKRAKVEETVGMNWRRSASSILLAMAFAGLWVSGCGSKTAANQVLVSVSGQFSVTVPTQTQTISAFVTGATDVTSTFACAYTTTPNPTTAVPAPKPSASAACDTAKTASGDPAVGTLTPIASTDTTRASTATFLAPKVFPDQTKLPNVVVTITATSKADTKKSGTFTIKFDSGIRITLTPATATLGTVSTQQFFAKDLNGLIVPPDQLTWGVTFEVTGKTSSVSCSGGSNDCGSVDKTGKYTAPASVPKAAPSSTTIPVNPAGIVTLFAFSKVDNARISQAAITIVKAGDIAFSGISPSVIPQGALQQDIFLAATNATSQIGVVLTAPCGDIPVDQQAQIKVVFAPGTTSSSIGARIRLNSTQLTAAGHYQLQVISSNPSVKVTGGPFPLDVIPVRPTILSSAPENLQESTLGQNGITIDGGYFGTTVGTLPTCTVSPTIAPLFNNTLSAAPPSSVTARRLSGFLPTPSASNPNAGLFPLSVKYSTSPGPFAAPAPDTAYTNIAVIPDYAGSNSPGALTQLVLPAVSVPTSPTVPSAIALDSVLGYAVVTLAGQNAFTPSVLPAPPATVNTANNVQFINLAGGTPTLAMLVSSQGFLATGVAVDDQLHVAAVVNYASRSLTIHSIPSGALQGTLDLSNLIPPPATGGSSFVAPFPYSVGIDSFSHRAVVAFASTNVGLVINLDTSANPDPNTTCILPGQTATPNFCPIAYVTLSSGANPQIAFEPGAHLAYVTPGGAGQLSAVNLDNPSVGSVGVASATRASNVVTITTSAAHNLNPGNPGTVLISGLPQGSTKKTNFNGSFSVGNVLDATHFQYSQFDQDDTATCTTGCLASSGVPFLTYAVSPTTLGIAINPLTRRAILADPNATFSQINFIDPVSQSVSFMSLFVGATGSNTGASEIGAATVAFQPFTNTALSFNPSRNEISLLDPSLLQRAKIIPTGQTAEATASFTPDQAKTAVTVSLPGALAVDSINNVALAVNSGSDDISFFHLGQSGKIKTLNIERILTPPVDDPNDKQIPVKAKLGAAVKITQGAPSPAVGPVRILGSGFSATSKVRLDTIDVTTLGATVALNGTQELDVTFPAGVFTGPRHFALDVANSAVVTSNIIDFTVFEEVILPACSGTAAAPGGVAIDEVHNLALVTNTGCHQVSVISLDPARAFGTITNTIQTGATPTGVAVLPQLAITGQPAGTSGVAVVTNNSANTVTILDLVSLAPVAGVTDVAVGTSPSGVAIDQETNFAVIANSGSSNVSTIDLTPLTAKPIGKLAASPVATDSNPIAVAIDPDRGTNGRGLASVAGLQSNGGGTIDVVDIGGATPARLSSLGVQSTPTGIVFDPAVSPALFYLTSTQGNQITAFNPDTNQTVGIKVGINPTAIAYNFQTGTMLTVNALSNSISIVDSQTFQTKATLGIGGTSRFSAAIHSFTNLAVIADQANNRVLLFPLPK